MTTRKNNDSEERNRLYESARKEILDVKSQNMNNLGKSILTLSSGAIGVSLFFLKYNISSGFLQYKGYLFTSWVFLVASILFIVISYLLGGPSASKQLKLAEEYYLNGNDDYLKKKNIFDSCINILNLTGSLSFIVGIVLLLLFASTNCFPGL
jgi:hypothetical protein